MDDATNSATIDKAGLNGAAAVLPEPDEQVAGKESVDAGTTASVPEGSRQQRRTRTVRTYPASSFLEALPLADAIQRHAAGQKVRRLTLFENLGRSAESGTSRQLVTNSVQYGLTTGSYAAEWLELTPEGALASSDETRGTQRLAARLELAFARIEPFQKLYNQYKGNRLPAPGIIRDFIISEGLTPDLADECVETFLANARDLGLLRNLAGAERLLTFEMLLDESGQESPLSNEEETRPAPSMVARTNPSSSPAQIVAEASDLSDVCFVISPIGADGSEHRRHANLVLGSLIEPALEGLGLRIVRADRISKPGLITAQIIEHIVRAPLVVADLSYGNPNVFYELALRHACRKPAVQIIRTADHLPFDVGQFRTVVIDMTDVFTLVPQIDTYRAEIARQCRSALADAGPVDSPLSLFFPTFWTQFTAGS